VVATYVAISNLQILSACEALQLMQGLYEGMAEDSQEREADGRSHERGEEGSKWLGDVDPCGMWIPTHK